MTEDKLNKYRQLCADIAALLERVKALTAEEIGWVEQECALGALAGAALDLYYYVKNDDRDEKLAEHPYPYTAIFGLGEASGYLIIGLKRFPKQPMIDTYQIQQRLVKLITGGNGE